MKEQLSVVGWKRVSIAAVAGVVLALAVTSAWRDRNGWCARFYPDGSREVLYGAECQMPE